MANWLKYEPYCVVSSVTVYLLATVVLPPHYPRNHTGHSIPFEKYFFKKEKKIAVVFDFHAKALKLQHVVDKFSECVYLLVFFYYGLLVRGVVICKRWLALFGDLSWINVKVCQIRN